MGEGDPWWVPGCMSRGNYFSEKRLRETTLNSKCGRVKTKARRYVAPGCLLGAIHFLQCFEKRE